MVSPNKVILDQEIDPWSRGSGFADDKASLPFFLQQFVSLHENLDRMGFTSKEQVQVSLLPRGVQPELANRSVLPELLLRRLPKNRRGGKVCAFANPAFNFCAESHEGMTYSSSAMRTPRFWRQISTYFRSSSRI